MEEIGIDLEQLDSSIKQMNAQLSHNYEILSNKLINQGILKQLEILTTYHTRINQIMLNTQSSRDNSDKLLNSVSEISKDIETIKKQIEQNYRNTAILCKENKRLIDFFLDMCGQPNPKNDEVRNNSYTALKNEFSIINKKMFPDAEPAVAVVDGEKDSWKGIISGPDSESRPSEVPDNQIGETADVKQYNYVSNNNLDFKSYGFAPCGVSARAGYFALDIGTQTEFFYCTMEPGNSGDFLIFPSKNIQDSNMQSFYSSLFDYSGGGGKEVTLLNPAKMTPSGKEGLYSLKAKGKVIWASELDLEAEAFGEELKPKAVTPKPAKPEPSEDESQKLSWKKTQVDYPLLSYNNLVNEHLGVRDLLSLGYEKVSVESAGTGFIITNTPSGKAPSYYGIKKGDFISVFPSLSIKNSALINKYSTLYDVVFSKYNVGDLRIDAKFSAIFKYNNATGLYLLTSKGRVAIF